MSGQAADLAITGGQVVSDGGVSRVSVMVTAGRVTALLEAGAPVEAREVVDAGGAYVLPGAIDPHVHFRIFNAMADDFETASVCAAFGGVTTMIPFVGGGEGLGLLAGVEQVLAEGERRSVVDFAMHARLRPDPAEIDRIPEVVRLGIPSVKMFMAYRKRGMLFSDDLLLRGMELAAAHGALVLVHAENGWVIDHLEDRLAARGHAAPADYLRSRPHAAEAEAVARAIALAGMAGCALYVVHLSTAEGLDEIARARARRQPVLAETCPQYLLLTDAEMARQKGLAKIAPPLRWDRDREALWQGLEQGLVQTIGSDHAPFAAADKGVGETDIFAAGFGMPGLETMVPLVLGEGRRRGRLSMPDLVRALSESPARIFGLYPRKGTLRVGADADIVLYDPAAEDTIRAATQHSRAGYTCYEGWSLRGRITRSFLRGRPLVRDGRLCQPPGSGRFLRRGPTETP